MDVQSMASIDGRLVHGFGIALIFKAIYEADKMLSTVANETLGRHRTACRLGCAALLPLASYLVMPLTNMENTIFVTIIGLDYVAHKIYREKREQTATDVKEIIKDSAEKASDLTKVSEDQQPKYNPRPPLVGAVVAAVVSLYFAHLGILVGAGIGAAITCAFSALLIHNLIFRDVSVPSVQSS